MASIRITSFEANPSVFTIGQTVTFTVGLEADYPSDATTASTMIKVGYGTGNNTLCSSVKSTYSGIGHYTGTATFAATIPSGVGGMTIASYGLFVDATLIARRQTTVYGATAQKTYDDFKFVRLSPMFSVKLSAKRAIGDAVNDEGSDLCALASVLCGPDKINGLYPRQIFNVTETLRVYYAEERAATTEDSYLDVPIGGLASRYPLTTIPKFIHDAGLSSASNFGLLMVYTVSAYGSIYTESCSSATTLSRAFANVHLSGAVDANGKQIGGVAFGKFSSVKSTDEIGKFECVYPAIFENGVFDGDGEPIGAGPLCGVVESQSFKNGYNLVEISFGKTFSAVPVVMAVPNSGDETSTVSRYIGIDVVGTTTTGCKLRVYNSYSGARVCAINWVAIC